MGDQLQAFLLNQNEYRGVLVHLKTCYQKIIDLHVYPKPIALLLGEALAAVSLLGHSLKQEGKLALQIETEEHIRFLVAEINHQRGIRGLVQWRDEMLQAKPFLDKGKFALTITPQQGERYQGIVPLTGGSMAKSLESYFGQSEQIFSKMVLASDEKSAAGLFIQKLPDVEPELMTLSLETLNFILETVRSEELLMDNNEALLHKLFHEQEVRIFPSEKVHFECTCSHEKMENAVRLLGKAEVQALLSTHQTIEVACEFCNHHYAFNKNEVEKLF